MNAAEPQPPALKNTLVDLDGEEADRPAATLRLRQAIGEELARHLVRALAGDHRSAAGLSAAQS
jgi:hypothetical protein